MAGLRAPEREFWTGLGNVGETPRGVVRCNAEGETGAAVCAAGVLMTRPREMRRRGAQERASAGSPSCISSRRATLRQVMRS